MSITRTPAGVNAAFAALCVAALVVLALGGDMGRGITLTTASAAIATSIAVTRLRTRATGGAVWWLAFIAFCVLTVTSAIWLIVVHIGGAASPPQPITDASRALGYLLLLAAALFVISPAAKRDPGGVLDATTTGVAGALTLWLTLLNPALDKVDATTTTRLYALVAVAILSALTGAMLRAVTTSKAARPALAYFLVSVTVTLIANVLAVTGADPRTGATPTWAFAIGAFAYIAAWAAAMHPASDMISAGPQDATGSLLSRPRIVLLGLALGIGPLLGAVRQLLGEPVNWLTLSVAEMILVAMVLTRVAQLAAAHRDADTQLEYLANHDSLTGLANRRAVDRHLEALATRVGAGQAPGVVFLFVDLNGFKAVNDDHGHRVGDELLAAVAARLAESVRKNAGDLVGRLGGDEFVLIVEGDPDEVGESAMERARLAFLAPFDLTSGPMPVTASIGMASAPRGAHVSVDALLTEADHEMYTRKRSIPEVGVDHAPSNA